MKKKNLLVLFCGLFIFSSCAKHITVNYQTDSTNTGNVVLKVSRPTQNTYVTLNDQLMIDKKNVKSLTVKNVPNGEYNLHYVSESSRYKEKLDAQMPITMVGGKEVTKLVEVPPYSNGYWVYNGLALFPLFFILLIDK